MIKYKQLRKDTITCGHTHELLRMAKYSSVGTYPNSMRFR